MGAATGWTSLCSSRWGPHAAGLSWPLSPSRAASFWSSSGVMAIMRSSAVNSSRPVANFSVGADRQAGFALLGEYDLRGELQLLQPDGGGAHVDGDDSSVGSLRGEGPFDGHTQPLQQLPGGCGEGGAGVHHGLETLKVSSPRVADGDGVLPAPDVFAARQLPQPWTGHTSGCHGAVGCDRYRSSTYRYIYLLPHKIVATPEWPTV